MKFVTNVRRWNISTRAMEIYQMLEDIWGAANERNVWNHMLSQLPLQTGLRRWRRRSLTWAQIQKPQADWLKDGLVQSYWCWWDFITSYSSPNLKHNTLKFNHKNNNRSNFKSLRKTFLFIICITSFATTDEDIAAILWLNPVKAHAL